MYFDPLYFVDDVTHRHQRSERAKGSDAYESSEGSVCDSKIGFEIRKTWRERHHEEPEGEEECGERYSLTPWKAPQKSALARSLRALRRTGSSDGKSEKSVNKCSLARFRSSPGFALMKEMRRAKASSN